MHAKRIVESLYSLLLFGYSEMNEFEVVVFNNFVFFLRKLVKKELLFCINKKINYFE